MSELRTNRIVPRDGLTSGTFNGGGVVQVRHSAFTGIDDATGGINTALTDFESTYNCTITPTRSDSKILVEMSMSVGYSNDNNIVMARLRKKVASGSFADVDGALGTAASNRYRCTAVTVARINEWSMFPLQITYLDSPATTSALTYSVSVAHDSNSNQTIYLNRAGNDGDFAYSPRAISTITLTEITG